MAGIACKLIYPIPTSLFYGNGTYVSICTLSSIGLLKKISKLELMNKILLAGRLFSENRGIDQMISYCVSYTSMKHLILCGKDTPGHYPGDALVNLMKHGLNEEGKIVGTIAHSPFLKSNTIEVEKFRKQITLIDMRECFDLQKISKAVNSICLS